MLVSRLIFGLGLCLPLWCNAAPVAVGQAAPAIDLPALPAGTAGVTLEGLRGSVVYVDFWASWCGPCRISFPLLDDMRTELGPRGFEVLAINLDEFEEDALKFLAEMPVSYLVVRDANGTSPQAYGILGMPTGFLVDKQGVVRHMHQGFRKSDGPRLKAEILKLLDN